MSQGSSGNQNTETVMSGYRLLRGLGRGNTSRVYLAEKVAPEPGLPGGEAGSPSAVRSGARVALKLPLPSTLADQAAAERFANEVRLSLQFRHPNLVVGLDGTPFGPETFLAMHHYPGGTLAQQLGVGPLSLAATLQVLTDVASGLAALHRAGAVHQDVKTQNVYLEATEEPGHFRAALGDFGSTYFQAQGGQVSGSPFYMAPEVYQGEMTGPPSDVYSFGVLAHELLTGERPHLGDSYERLMISHLTHYPVQLNIPDLPRGLARLLDASLAKRAADRPTSAALRRALLSSLGQPDETEAVTEPEPQTPVAAPVSRASVGRHGPDSALATRAPTFTQPSARPAEPPSPAPGKRGWNPFRKK